MQATLIEIFGTAAVDAVSSILLGVPQFKAFISAIAANPTVATLLSNIGMLADATGQVEVGVLVRPWLYTTLQVHLVDACEPL
jgi:hypothetical protein